MRKGHIVLIVVLAAAVAGNILIAGLGHSAETRAAEEPMLNAAMRLDVTPLTDRIERLEAELMLMRAMTQDLTKNVQAMQQDVRTMAAAMDTLKRPERYSYRLVRSTSMVAANQLGEQGWEMVNATDTMMIFRRPGDHQED